MGWLVVDVLVGVGLVAMSALMAYLGIRVTFYPPLDEIDKRKKKKQFILLGLAAAALTIVQVVRNGFAQKELIEAVKANTPKVEITNTLPPATVIQQAVERDSNVPLKEKAFALASKVRKLSGTEKDAELSSTFQGWRVMLNGTDEEKKELKATDSKNRQDRFQQYLSDYQRHYMRDAVSIRDELLKKLPPGTRNDGLKTDYEKGFGTDSLDRVADDLERLALLVPDN
jgi:hypothetical protein